MPYESLLLLGCSAIFAIIYLLISISQAERSLFDVVLKDICVILCFLFILFALNTNQVLVSQTCITPHLNLTTVPICDNWSFVYAHDTTLDSLGGGFAYVIYALIILFFGNMIFEIYDYLTRSKKKKA